MVRMPSTIFTIIGLAVLAHSAPGLGATVGYWRFESNLLDASGNGNTGSHPPTPAFSTNVFGTSVPRNGLSNTRSLNLANSAGNVQALDYMTVADDPSLDIATGSFTIEAWIRLDEFAPTSTRRYYVAQKKDIGDKDGLASYTFIARLGNIGSAGDEQKLALEFGDGVGPDGTPWRLIS
mgnify:FL=1